MSEEHGRVTCIVSFVHKDCGLERFPAAHPLPWILQLHSGVFIQKTEEDTVAVIDARKQYYFYGVRLARQGTDTDAVRLISWLFVSLLVPAALSLLQRICHYQLLVQVKHH